MIKELPNNHIGVKLPEDARNVKLHEDSFGYWIIGYPQIIIKLPRPGSYTLLFTTKDKVTEEMAALIVEGDSNELGAGYMDYNTGEYVNQFLPSESLSSLLRSLDMTGNWAILKRENK